MAEEIENKVENTESGLTAEEKEAKKEAKKAKKAEEARLKAEKKAKQQAERDAAAAAKKAAAVVPEVTLLNFEEHEFGNLFIQSHKQTDRKWSAIKELNKELNGQTVWLRCRVQNSRAQGAKLCFLTLRRNMATIQAVVFGKEFAAFAADLPKEAVVDVFGEISVPAEEIHSCTQKDVELQVKKLYCTSRAEQLNIQLEDAGRSDAEYKRMCEQDPENKPPVVSTDVRLDNRVVELRTRANQGIFRIQGGVCRLFREYLMNNCFNEIHTPKLIGGASEGGADVFRVDYFPRYGLDHAYLAQSPQLYKQMSLMADLDRVFEIGPVFRSENSFTHRHMCEFTGLDMEMTFMESYHEVLDMLDGMFNHIFTGLNKYYKDEIEAVREQWPFEDLKWKYPCLRIKYPEAIKLLREFGPAILEKRIAAETDEHEKKVLSAHLESIKVHGDSEDISTPDEKLIGEVVKQQYEQEFFIIDKFPAEVRPFYSMPDPVDPTWANSYDFFIRGEEILSGAQRIHEPEMLRKNAEKFGLDAKSIEPYIDAFKYGAYPHAGAGVGMERVVMLFLKLSNIRQTSMFPRDPKRLAP